MIHVPLSPDGNFVRNPHVLACTAHLGKWPIPFEHPRQDAPHAHQIVIHGDEILIPDLGSNLVSRQLPPRDGRNWDIRGAVLGYEAGDGPRHVVVHPKGNSSVRGLQTCADSQVHTCIPYVSYRPRWSPTLYRRFLKSGTYQRTVISTYTDMVGQAHQYVSRDTRSYHLPIKTINPKC